MKHVACSMLLGACVLFAFGCDKDDAPRRPSTGAASDARETRSSVGSCQALLLAKAHFERRIDAHGVSRMKPAPAQVVVLRRDGETWLSEVIEDSASNVFHKAMPFDIPGESPGILTIGAAKSPDPATMKVWRRGADGWQDECLWEVRFGGRFNRLRDIEIADVTGDDKPEIVIASHDQGVVAVLRRQADGWRPQVIDHRANTFVHEIEVGDVDGDGQAEVYATPSAPNRVGEEGQPGWIIQYRWNGEAFSRQVVATFSTRHVKEILVADLVEGGLSELYAALDVQLRREGAPRHGEPEFVELHRCSLEDGGFVSERIATLPDAQCRFLNAGDVDGDGRAELIASGFKSGLWMLRPAEGDWSVEQIDADSSGYEHATTLADFDGDGAMEIYVAADDQQQLRRYRWTGQVFERSVLRELVGGDLTFGLTACDNAACLEKRQSPMRR